MYDALKDVVTIIALCSFGFAMLVGLVTLGAAVIGWIKGEIKRYVGKRNIVAFPERRNDRGNRKTDIQ